MLAPFFLGANNFLDRIYYFASLLDTYVAHYFEQFKLPGSGFVLEFCERCANISVGQ